jgi:hypothetical protein
MKNIITKRQAQLLVLKKSGYDLSNTSFFEIVELMGKKYLLIDSWNGLLIYRFTDDGLDLFKPDIHPYHG